MRMSFDYNTILSTNLASMTLDNVFSEEECSIISKIGQNSGLADSMLFNSDIEPTIRKSKSAFLHPVEENLWFFEKIMSAVNWVNENYFQFELYGFSSMQYTEYGPDGDFYNWHKDLIFKPNNGDRASTTHSRKLSASVILSNRDEYLGGELYIERDSNNYPVNRILQNIGSIVFFPSFIDHMVAPVTEGTRKSLVVWVEGPKLK